MMQSSALAIRPLLWGGAIRLQRFSRFTAFGRLTNVYSVD